MADMPDWYGVKLTDDQQAINIGFAEGAHLRKGGGKPEHVNGQREMLERGYPNDRGDRNTYHAAWRLGFDAGYLEEGKPTIEKLKSYFKRNEPMS